MGQRQMVVSQRQPQLSLKPREVLGEAIDACFQRGCDEITVLPYFLSPGVHVISDVPAEIAAAQSKWPDKTITLLPHIGATQAMVDLIAQAY